MTGAMYAAVSGLKAHMDALNVIGNNIANVNTHAYKATRYTFLEALYTNVRSGSNGSAESGGKNPAQIGYGASIGTIDLDMSTKTYSPTGHDTDCMIDGDGFFIMGGKQDGPFTSPGELKNMYLSRLGNIEFDNDGYLKDGQGRIVYGFLNVVGDGADANNVDNTEPCTKLTAIRLPMASDGTDDAKLGSAVYPEAGDDTGDVLDATEGVNGRIVPDSVAIDEKTGRITCTSSAGETVVVGYIALAKVDNPNGVTHVDGHYYKALDGAGNVHLTSLGGEIESEEDAAIPILSAGETKLVTGGLESSGTNLASEISNMIMVQRGYQANTRIVSVTDSMLEELVNMKR